MAVPPDLLDDEIGRRMRRAKPGAAAAEIVHDNLRATLRQRQRIILAKAVAGAGNDGDPAVETDFI
jgi:hypothetical protein